MQENILKLNTLEIWSETFGDRNRSAVLLIMGAGAQGIFWPTEFCQQIANLGYYVIRYDHRDTGQSSSIDFSHSPYNLVDLANDALSVLDALHIKQAHIMGASMGGYIAQLLAVYHADRVLSLNILTSTIDLSPLADVVLHHKMQPQPKLPYPTPEVIALLTHKQPPANSMEEKIKREVSSWRLLNGGASDFPKDFYYSLSKAGQMRIRNTESAGNHLLAIDKTFFDVSPHLVKVNCPTIILHGTHDPILPLAHGEALAKAMPQAKFTVIPNMGHMLTPVFLPKIVTIFKENIV